MRLHQIFAVSCLTLLGACGGGSGGMSTNMTVGVSVSPAYSLVPYDLSTVPPVNNSGPQFFNADSKYSNLVTSGLDPAKLNSILTQDSNNPLNQFAALIQGLLSNANQGRWNWGSKGFSWGGFRDRQVQLVSYSNLVLQPADVREAYQMLPLVSATNADKGVGQTIYIVNAYHHPNIVSDLNNFNTRFNLPPCTSRTLSASDTLPLSPDASGCKLIVAYASSNGGAATNTAPATKNSWITEIASDVEWAHATAPMANIVLIEAVDATVDSLVSAIQLANKMGPGIVSMSFAAVEGSWVNLYESSLFSTAGMTYVAASGDQGAQVNWPAVSAKVIAVGGTTLSWNGNLYERTELAWSGSGVGVSSYISMPSYQTSAGIGAKYSTNMRAVPDVSFNADPRSGQYVYVTLPGLTNGSWYVIGGTSIAAPQWSGILATNYAQKIANNSSQPINTATNTIYQYVGSVSGTYSTNFFDVISGSDSTSSTCTTCDARIGYDLVTGWGSPNSTTSLLSTLAAH